VYDSVVLILVNPFCSRSSDFVGFMTFLTERISYADYRKDIDRDYKMIMNTE
jgi:hypothetical protein